MNQPLLQRVDAYLRGISHTDRVCIVHDTDPDGVCSAVIIAKCIERLRGRKIDLRLSLDKKQHAINVDMLAEIRKAGINKLITTDFSLEQNMDTVRELEGLCEILVIDHHKMYADVDSPRTILYKPQLFSNIDPSRYCTGKLAFDAAMRVADVSDLDWIAASACIADIATAPWSSWLKSVFKKYKFKPKKNWFDTVLGQVASTITSAEVYDIKLVAECFDVFYKAKGSKDVLKSKLGKCKTIVDKELKYWIKRFPKGAERHGELRIFEIKPKFHLQGPVSTILGLKYPHNTIIVADISRDFISISARRGDKKLAVNTLLEKAVEGLKDAHAGGHVPAAGAGFNKMYYSVFKKRVIAMAGGVDGA